jgi:hypothetical protein
MNNLQWIKLKRDFEEQRVVLMIGPHLAETQISGKSIPMQDALSQYLADFLDEEGVEYDQSARKNLSYIALRFLSIKGARRVDLEDLSKDFIEQNSATIPEVYQWLAKLPVHLIINTNGDDYIQRALLEAGKQPVTRYYNFRREVEHPIDIDRVSADTPLVYNLFGALESKESLVLTDEDQLEFIRSVVKDNPKIPEEVLSQFDDRKTYLFFGFNLEAWQFRLLLDGLELKEKNTTLSPRADRYPLSAMTKTFYKERFNFHFIDKAVDSFLDELSEKVIAQKAKNNDVTEKVFLLYHPKDEDFKNELENCLSQLIKNEELELWYPQKFIAGTDDEEVLESLRGADIVLPIMSPNFLADTDLMDRLLPLAAEQDNQGKSSLRPIIARPCDWRENISLRTKPPFPENSEAITSNYWNTRDDAYFNIVQSLKKLLK